MMMLLTKSVNIICVFFRSRSSYYICSLFKTNLSLCVLRMKSSPLVEKEEESHFFGC